MGERLGFVGLGAMGAPVARRLAAAGHEVIGYDRSPEVLARVAQEPGMAGAESVEQVVAACTTLFTCLPTPEAVEEVMAGIAKDELLLCDLSTVGPGLAVRIHERLAARGVRHVECPMIGGAAEAVSGQLFLVLSGERADVERLLPLLRLFSRDHRYVGATGNASRFKTVHNGLGLVQLCAIAEALAMLAAAGADLEAFVDVVNEGRGMACTPLFRAKAPLMLERAAPVVGELHIGAKDARLADALARELGLDLPLFARSERLLAEAMRQGLGKQELAQVARVVEAWTGTRIAAG